MTAFGVYVHVPFCARRCDYCDFATWTDRHHLMDAYAAACVTDLARRSERQPFPAATSVFFGGGTPSLLPADLLLAILAAVPCQAGAEVTVECNPDTVTPELLAAYRAGGVTRLSFGVQSMAPHVLVALGRTHDPAAVERAVAAARDTGFAGTPLARRIDAGDVPAPDDDDQAEKYLAADVALTAADRPWYEISNWARPGRECRHNLLYWAQGEYLGIGCAAHGHTPLGRRWWNVRTPDRYIALIGEGASPEAAHEILEVPERAAEATMLALRTRDGVPVSPAAEGLVADGLAEYHGQRIVLTTTGRLLANEATTRLLAVHSSC
jgi:coproporphyrinogen III oxidase-like Fe-S oxidoreductase